MSEPKLKITFSEVERKTDLIVEYIKTFLPYNDVRILNNAVDEFCPEGLTFIFPDGAIMIDPMTEPPKFDYINETMRVTYTPKFLSTKPYQT